MTRKIIITLLIISISTSLVFATPRDAQFHWAGTEINTLIENDIMVGYEDGRFKPSRSITKEEACVLFVGFAKHQDLLDEKDLSIDKSLIIPDAKSLWSLKEIQFLYKAGIIKADSNGFISPLKPLTREGLAQMLYNYFQYFNLLEDLEMKNVTAFTDTSNSYANLPIDTMHKAGILNGFPNGTFKPKDNVSRGEIASILYKISSLEPIAPLITLPKTNIVEVAYLSQIDSLNAWVGCEATSLLMGLHAKGYSQDIDIKTFLDALPRHESNPAKGFVGSPYIADKSKKTRTTIYPAVLVNWRKTYGNILDFSGSSAQEIRAEILDGNPVVIYMTLWWEKPFYRDFNIEGQTQSLLSNNHVVLARGYDSVTKSYLISDPYNIKMPNEKYEYWIDRYTFENIYNVRKQAIVIQ